MKHEIAISRGLRKVDPRRIPHDPIAPTAPSESESYALGHDARNDFRPIDENPYATGCEDHQDWATGWADADRALDEYYNRKLDERGPEEY
jgi:hypothetical protein